MCRMCVNSIGELYLPDAFAWLAYGLKHLDKERVLGDKNNRIALETLLRREILLRANRIRSRSDLQNSVLTLLDVLVDEYGSSVAFQLRERTIRPAKRR